MLGGTKVFSKLDANSGFWLIWLAEESPKCTTFITPFGRYCLKRLPFRISSAPELFQMRMNRMLERLEGVVCHMDAILMVQSSSEEHDRVMKSQGCLNKRRCEFARSEVKFLGHKLSAEGVQPDPDKLTGVQNMKQPTTVSEVWRFLGMVNQLGKFIPDLSEKSKPPPFTEKPMDMGCSTGGVLCLTQKGAGLTSNTNIIRPKQSNQVSSFILWAGRCAHANLQWSLEPSSIRKSTDSNRSVLCSNWKRGASSCIGMWAIQLLPYRL